MPAPLRPALLGLMALALLVVAQPALAQQETRRPSHCIALVERQTPERIWRATWQDPVPQHSLRLHYISHASFLLRSPAGLNVVTDYNGFIGTTQMVPDVVTMNHAHDTHWTAAPDPAIPHALRGWGDSFGGGADHHLDLGDMLIRNVSTDIRSPFGGSEPRGNSIFIFEVAGLCVGHLGHLHHEPTADHYAQIGRLDVVMVPVDGGHTLPLDTVLRVVDRLQSSVVIPMHWFSQAALDRFLDGVAPQFAIERLDRPDMLLSLRDLPRRPTVRVLRPDWLRDPD